MIRFETEQESFVPEDIDEINALDTIRDKLGGGEDTIILIFRTDPSDPQYGKDIRDREVLSTIGRISALVISQDLVTSSRSVLDIVDEEGTRNEINYEISSSPFRSSFVSDDYSITIATYGIMVGVTPEKQKEVYDYVNLVVAGSEKPLGLDIDIAGSIAINEELGKTIGSSMGMVTIFGFVGVFVVLYIFFRRPTFILVSVLPIIFATLWTFGTMGLIGIPFTTILTGVFSIIIGLGIDFGIHIVHRFEEDKRRYSLDKAIENTVVRVGNGITLTTVTTIIGFLALLAATLPLLRDFSVSLSIGVLYSLIAALGIIPPSLVLIERLSEKRKRGKKKGK